ncbi:MAG: hypothetical protein BroJett033_2220 [Chloroflexota bacterium]|nr:MAG: hypothetical protein BroJett033_2220 [Chloroflexota bacterium]
MAEISLKEYYDKLEALLRANQVDEVVYHCRHILQYYPRSAATYRLLGRALLANGSAVEAEEVFRRLLSVYPDDVTAHASLATIYRQAGRYDEAIWHLEHVYEQDTANSAHQQALRDLYREHRGVDQPRLQLTAGAVARQYLNSGLYDEAARALRETLADTSQRVDLRLLLARALWDGGQRVESAEAALDVLEAAPDCLEANRIMARFWLDEKRPSDAQRYVGRIEALDPYAAYQIAQGGPAPDTAFTLPELDYERIAKRRLATETPDWLGAIDAQADSAPPPADAVSAPASAAADDDLPDWLTADDSASLDELFDAPAAGPASAEAGLSLEFDDAELPTFAAEAPSASEHTGFTGMLAALNQPDDQDAAPQPDAEADEPLESGDLPDWLLEAAPLDSASAAAPAADADWFSELAAEAEAAPPPVSAPDPDDALAWLYGSGIELTDEAQAAGPAEFAADDADMVYADPAAADPLAWLYGSDIELTDEAQAAAPLAAVDEDVAAAAPLAAPALPLAADDDDDDAALDWLSDESLLDEMLDMEALAAGDDQPADDDTPLGWSGLTETLPGAALAAEQQPEDSPVLDDESDWQTEMPDKDQQLPDWLQPEDDEPESPEEAFSWLDEQPPDEAAAGGADDASALPPAEMPAWLAEAQPGADDSQFEWLAAALDEPEGDELAAAAGEVTPDWLAGAAQTAPLSADALADFDDSALTDWPGQEADKPEWLTQLAGGFEAEPAADEAAAQAGDSFDWAADVPLAAEVEDAGAAWAETGADKPEWLAQFASDAEEAFEAEPQAEIPDWLAAAAPLAQGAVSEEEPEPVDIPDWLAAAAPLAAETAFAAEEEFVGAQAEEMFDWDAPEAEPQAAAVPADELEQVDTAQLGELPAADEGVQPWEEGAAEAVPLAERGPAAWQDDDQALAAEVGEWSSEAITPAAAAALADPEPDYIFEPARSEFGWLEDIGDAGAAEEAPLAGEADFAPADIGAEIAGEADWLSAEAEEAAEAVRTDLLADEAFAPAGVGAEVEGEADWLSAEAEEAEAMEEALLADEAGFAPAEIEGEAESWSDAADTDAELERMYAAAHRPPPADNAPEWLNNMVPGLELDYEVEEDAPLESAFVRQPGAAAEDADSDFNWLNRIVDEETGPLLAVSAAAAVGAAAAGPRQPRYVFTRPPAWLRQPAAPPAAEPPADDDGADDAGDDDFELPDWLR